MFDRKWKGKVYNKKVSGESFGVVYENFEWRLRSAIKETVPLLVINPTNHYEKIIFSRPCLATSEFVTYKL